MQDNQTNLVTSFEEACKIKGLDPEKVIPDFSCYPEEFRAPAIAHAKMLIVLDVIKEGHKFDYNNRDEEKWYPWWDMEKDKNNPSGFRLYVAYYVYSLSFVCARLSLRSRKEIQHAVKHFEGLYRDMLT